MSASITELPIDRIDAAVALLGQFDCKLDAAQVRYQMSLLAHDGEASIGAAVACEVADGRIDLYVGFDPQQGDLALARRLADKALCKIHSHGVHRCRIVPVGPADVREFWQQVNWLDHALAGVESGRA